MLVSIAFAITPQASAVVQPMFPAVLLDIARCESGDRQFDANGTPLRGSVHAADIGLFQINTDIWEATAVRLGYDVGTEEGNIKMALYIYKMRGTKDWSATKSCWLKDN